MNIPCCEGLKLRDSGISAVMAADDLGRQVAAPPNGTRKQQNTVTK